MNIIKQLITNVLDFLPPVHPEGRIFVGIAAAATFILAWLFSSESIGWIGLILTAYCAYFFRDPQRVTPIGEELIISPADGMVSAIEEANLPSELGEDKSDEKFTRVSIFLSVLDVHINRAPVDGKIIANEYTPGKFLSANLDKASEENERRTILIKAKNGQEIACVQIAGLIARRIVCFIDEDQEIKAGERYGLIRFGSRLDVYLPKGVEPLVNIGQKAVGGETIIANMSGKSVAFEGEVR